MAKGFKQEEIDAVNSRLASLARIADEDVPKILDKVSGDIQKAVIADAPIRSGNLRRSVYQEAAQYKARVWIDTTITETRHSSKHFNYGRIVEHGRAGRYKTTPYFYNNVKRHLGKLVQHINAVIKDAAIRKHRK